MKYHSLEEIRKQKVVFATQDNQYYYYRLEPEGRFDSIIWRIQKLTGKVDTIHMTEYFKVEDGTRPITKPPDELKHYGIPGMRWGVRNGPPYPLDQQSHNKVVSGKSGSRSGSSNSKSKGDTKRGYAPTMTYLYTNGFTHWWLHATPEERRRHQKEYRKIFLGDKKPPELKTIPKLNRRDSVKQAVKKANPHFDQEDGGGKCNCTNVAIATALRLQGYKVAAKPASGPEDPRKYYKELIKNYRQCHTDVHYKEGSQKEAESLIKKALDGDKDGFGAITCYWKLGGGHIFNWVAKNGEITFIDGQTGSSDVGELYFKHVLPTPKGAYDDVFRLDKAIWKEDMLRKAIEVG